MRVLITVLSGIFVLASVFLIVKAGDKCSSVRIKPVTKIVKIGFVPLKGGEVVAAADVLKGIALANGIEFNVSTNKNTVRLNAPVENIKKPEGIIVFLKEINGIPYAVNLDRMEIDNKGIRLSVKLYKRGVK
jgi:hypothetical protein